MTSTKNRALPAWSWQEIYAKYKTQAAQFQHLAKFAKAFYHQDIMTIDVYTLNGNYTVVRHAWQLSFDEADGMLRLLDAEIARRNNLVGVM